MAIQRFLKEIYSSSFLTRENQQPLNGENSHLKISNFNDITTKNIEEKSKSYKNFNKKYNHPNKKQIHNTLESNKSYKKKNLWNKNLININKNSFILKNLGKNPEFSLNSSELTTEKESFLKKFNSINLNKQFNKDFTIINNNEENYNSIINENYLMTEKKDSEFFSYNHTISLDYDKKPISDRSQIFINKKLNNSTLKGEKKTNSKNKLKVIKLPKYSFNKNKKLKILINPIYDFNVNQNKTTTIENSNMKKLNVKANFPVNINYENLMTPINNNYLFENNSIDNKDNKIINNNLRTEKVNNSICDFLTNDNNNQFSVTKVGKKNNITDFDGSSQNNIFLNKNNSQTPFNRNRFINKYDHVSNQIFSNKNKDSINLKKFNYLFDDVNNTINSFIKSQTDLDNNSNLKSINSNLNSNINKNFTNYKYNHISKEMNNLIRKIQFDGDITNLKGRIKKK